MTTRGYVALTVVAGPLAGVAAVAIATVAAPGVGNPVQLYATLLLVVPALAAAALGASVGMRRRTTVAASVGASVLTYGAAVGLLILLLSHLEFTF